MTRVNHRPAWAGPILGAVLAVFLGSGWVLEVWATWEQRRGDGSPVPDASVDPFKLSLEHLAEAREQVVPTLAALVVLGHGVEGVPNPARRAPSARVLRVINVSVMP